MRNNVSFNMSLNLKRTKFYFLSIAILSFVIICISYNWNISENIFKISSKISKVRISGLNLPDIKLTEHLLRQSTRGALGEFIPGNGRNEFIPTTNKIERVYNNTKFDITESFSKEKNDGINMTNNMDKVKTPATKSENEKSNDSAGKQENETANKTEYSGQTIIFAGEQTVDNQTVSNTSKVSKYITEENQKTKSDGNDQQFIFEIKSSFDKLKNSTAETQQVLREIHRLKDEISGDYKRTSALQRNKSNRSKQKYQEVKNNNANQRTTERDFHAFHRIRNRLKHLGFSYNGLIMPFRHHDINFNDNTDNSDVTSRPDVCTGCFQKNFRKIINEPALCEGDVDLLFMITSTFSRKDSRNAIRNTWCGQCNKPNSKMKVVFVFGNRNNSTENKKLLEESKQYHDIIQLDFIDTYANLTYKTISSLQWSDDYCKKANYVMKTDDDMYVNTEILPVMLKAAPNKSFMGGMCWGPSSPHRNSDSKWYVSFVQYRHSLYPSMCSGTGYVMSRDVVSGILQESPNVPFFYLEDVYVAICVKRVGVTPLLLDGFKNQYVEFEPCAYRNRIITAHEMSADSLKYIWNESRTCPEKKLKPEIIYRPFPV